MQTRTDTSAPPIGLIAGGGRLPVLTAQGVRAAGRRVACVGLKDQYDGDLPGECDQFGHAGIIRLGRWVRLLRRWGVREAVMIGVVRKARMYEPLRLVRQFPDWRAARLWYRVLRHDRRSHALLGAVADELQRSGITLIDSTRYIPGALAESGVLTRRGPTAEQAGDIDFGWPLAVRLNELDIGQAVAVRDRAVIAVEAIEGTDAMIRRAGELCRIGGWTLIKAAGPRQDMRFDVPTIGPQTIETMHSAGAKCLVVETGRVIIADKPRVIELAERYGIAVVGREHAPAAG
ncbi:MAG: UDP-2,3-diacylglucosamine diphosphatase LpxI [Planctomycetes bacterium]|nr:UDP-2,3-diacylglucosamine diphosphatase LpxI [Planctomycetota bacterium]